MNFSFPSGPLIPNPAPLVPTPDFKTARIVGAIDNLENMNRLRDMDILQYQINLKEQQKSLCEKRLKSIDSTIDIKAGRILSLVSIIISVIIPFLIVALHEYIKDYSFSILVYIIVSFVFSMTSMIIYLFWFWKNKK